MKEVESADPRLPPRLPLWPTIRLSYTSYFRHFGDVLRISALWLSLMAVLNAGTGWMQAAWMTRVMVDPRPQPNLSEPLEMMLLGNISNVVIAFAAVSIAVAWHRRLLLNEPPGRSGGNIATLGLWRYIAVTIVVCVIAAAPALAVWLVVSAFGLMPAADDVIAPQTPALIAAFIVAYVAGIVILLRLCVLLPANAAGNFTLTVKGAWRLSRGNAWRLFWGIIACALPPFLLVGLVFVGTILLPMANGMYRVQWAVASAIATCCGLIAWPIWIGFLSHAYRHLNRT
jgi:hypothetical protein